MSETSLLDEIKKINAIADIGLLYATDEYNKERYSELRNISLYLLSKVSGEHIEVIKLSLQQAKDYPTAKVDIRGLLLSEDGKILLVKESADNRWSLPGGWADVGTSPKEVIIKEFKEETGLDVSVERLLAVFDKRMHAHPQQPFYVYKLAFYCRAITTNITRAFDVLDVQYFDINNLPELSEDRILKNQIQILYDKVIAGDKEAYFD